MKSTKITESDWTYPVSCAHAMGRVAGSHGHSLYWEQHGNPEGEPVLFVHGGPGGGCSPEMARFFNPQRYRIILFDQRGCGNSTPNAADSNPFPALEANTTDDLIEDIIRLRKHLAIEGQMHVFGGSWGSTLALAYAIAHPATVAGLVLRGIFLCRRQDLDYFYQGNAAVYESNPHDMSLPGAYLHYPEAWREFVSVIPPQERGDMVAAYAKRFATIPQHEQEDAELTRIARAWSMWEGVTSFLAHDAGDVRKFYNPGFARAFARIENHYFMHGGFLGGHAREQNYILENLSRLRGMHVIIRHGRYDQVCPLNQALALADGLRAAGAEVDLGITFAGHSMFERETALSLIDAMDNLPPL